MLPDIEPPRGGPEANLHSDYLTDRFSYNGRSERIHGFNKIARAIGSIPNIKAVEPLILDEKLYAEYTAHGLSPIIQECAVEIWTRLKGDQYPLIVRRLFPDQNGDAKTGPRSGNIKSISDLVTEIGKFYDFFAANYDSVEVSPEIMVHRVVDAGNPPLRENPFLPHPGGDITPIGPDTYQVRATFGADESVQGFPCDMWIVNYHPDGSVTISQPTKASKTQSRVPATGEYRLIEIPEDAQNVLPLNRVQVLSLVEVAKSLNDQYGGHRLEFDGTNIDGQESLVIIEAAPFQRYSNSYEGLSEFGDNIVRPVSLIRFGEDVDALPLDDLVIVHLPPQMFQGNDLRVTLTDLALTAKAKHIPLAVLVAGDIATQHAIRDIIDNGHAVWFTGKDEFNPGEEIRLYKAPTGGYDWERENVIVSQDRIQSRSLQKIGGKALGLQKLEAHGFRTSPYFVLESSLFRRVIGDLGLDKDLLKLDQLSPTDKIEYIARFTQGITEKIVNYAGGQIPDLGYSLARNGAGFSSVRSSAILEDGRISLAGIFDTKLNVGVQDIQKAILEVLASGVSPLAVKAALAANIKPSEASIAVIVQRMVKAQTAGTIFTKEHLTNDEGMLKIEVVKGLGNQIVDGTAVNTQQILVSKQTGEIKGNITPRSGPILQIGQIEQLARLGLAVEKALDEGPQDIEWAIDQNGDIILLQTRPL